MESPPWECQNIGLMGRGGCKTPYKHAGNEGGSDRAKEIHTAHHKPMYANKVGRQYSGLIHKQIRRHTIAEPHLQTRCRDSRMVHEIQHHSESVPHTGERQLHSGLLIRGSYLPTEWQLHQDVVKKVSYAPRNHR